MKKKVLAKMLVGLAVLALAGVVALAGASKGYVLTQGGRMVIATKAGARVVQPSIQEDAKLVKYFDNLSDYKYATYFCCYGWTISGSGSGLGAAYADGIPFTPTINGKVTKVEVGIGNFGGTNAATFSINSDASGLPGTSLGHVDVTGLPGFGTCCTVMTGKFSPAITVNKGTQYWLVVESSSGQTDNSEDAWNVNTTDMRSFPGAFEKNGTWAATSSFLGAAAILGH